jgi:hypothetical protein
MVAMFEIVFLILLLVLGSWWFSRTSTFRNLRSSGAARSSGRFGPHEGRPGIDPKNGVDPPNHGGIPGGPTW